MIRFFWKYRFVNLILILFFSVLALFNFNNFKVFFDSERIIELSSTDKDIVQKSIDDKNLLLVGCSLSDSLTYSESVKISELLSSIGKHKFINSVNSVFNEKIILNQSIIPTPINLFDLTSEVTYKNSINKLKFHQSNFISKNKKNLLIIIKSHDLDNELQKKQLLDFLDKKFSKLTFLSASITGQQKSEIYMKQAVVKEVLIFVLISSLLCSFILWYFQRSLKLVLVSLMSNFISITLSLSLSVFLFGGIELVMIIVPAIIFIITISDFMHLLNINRPISNKYKLFRFQMKNIGQPVFLTSLTTAIGFLSFAFGAFEPLVRFGIVTTLSIFISLFIIITLFSLIIDLRLIKKNVQTTLLLMMRSFLSLLFPYRKIILFLFVVLSVVGISKIQIDNFLTDELNNKSVLLKEINFLEKNFGGIKPLSFEISNDKLDHFNKIASENNINIDFKFYNHDNVLLKTRIKDIGSLKSNTLYKNVKNSHGDNIKVGGVGYLFDKISNDLTLEVLYGLIIAMFLIGVLFVAFNNFNLNYLFVSLIPNIIPLLSCIGLFSLFGFYISLSNAFIFAIVFGLIVDDSIHIISAYSINRRKKKSVKYCIEYCHNKTFNAVIKTTIVIILSLVPLIFSEFKSISQLASITITSAVIAVVFDLLFLPSMLKRFIK